MTSTPANLTTRHDPRTVSDRVARGFTTFLRFIADTFFARRYGHRAVVLETVAAVPGMVGATLQHLKSLRRMRKRWRLDPYPAGGGRERAHASDDVHRNRQAQLA
jgi:hypothetical protein